MTGRSVGDHEEHPLIAKNTICLWYDREAEDAARFYASVFLDSRVDAVHRAPTDFSGGSAGKVLVVRFTVLGIPASA